MLTESQCMKIEKALTEEVEPRKLAAYLCLHMGLTVSEVSALRLRDLDFENKMLTVGNSFTKSVQATEESEIDTDSVSRTLPIPPHVINFLKTHLYFYGDCDCLIINGKHSTSGEHLLQNLLYSINKRYGITDNLTGIRLRNAFIRRCIQSGIGLYSICFYIGIKQPNVIVKRFAQYFEPKLENFNDLVKYTEGYTPLQEQEAVFVFEGPKRMNLLILGAGSQGHVVRETAEALSLFHEIAFLDDDTNNKLAIDTCDNYKKYIDLYPIAFPSFGNCELRAKWIDRLEKEGFILPTLIHPMASVSPSAVIEEGTIIEMKAIVSTNARIKRGCIISSGAVVDLNAVICENTHIGSAATIKKNSIVPMFSVVSSGDIVGLK